MAVVTEIAPDVYRISTYLNWANLQFNQFLVKDEDPLLFHTGLKSLFPDVVDAVRQILDPATLRWISFSHFEADECCSLNEWLQLAPNAEPLCSLIGKIVSVDDYAARTAVSLAADEALSTGKYRFRYIQTSHVPHGWDAGVLFEETNRVLFCSDIFQQSGDVEPVIETDVVDRTRDSLIHYQGGMLPWVTIYTQQTHQVLNRLADLKPQVCATMHGSTFTGDCETALRDMDPVIKEVLSMP